MITVEGNKINLVFKINSTETHIHIENLTIGGGVEDEIDKLVDIVSGAHLDDLNIESIVTF